MSPDNPFLQALLAQPDDDTFRLAMADWFIENGRPERAEFIRVQVELAAGVADPDRRRELEVRQRDLLIAHEAEWVKPLAEALDCRPGEWGGWVFRRGFVEYFHLPAKIVNRRGHLLAHLTPVRELYLRPVNPGNVVALCRGRPWVRSLTHLYLDGMRMTDAAARRPGRVPVPGRAEGPAVRREGDGRRLVEAVPRPVPLRRVPPLIEPPPVGAGLLERRRATAGRGEPGRSPLGRGRP